MMLGLLEIGDDRFLHVCDRRCCIQEGCANSIRGLGDLLCQVILGLLDLGEYGCRLLFQGFANGFDLLVLYIGDDLAGYVKEVGDFTQVLVRNAGHMVPYDQPKWSFDLINRWTSGKKFN